MTKANVSQFYIGSDAGGSLDFAITTVGAGKMILSTTNTARVTIGATGDVGIGVSVAGALIHGIKTTEQLRLGYDASNYASYTVGSTGSLTVALTGTSPTMTVSNNFIVGSGKTLTLGNAAVTGLVAGALAATTNASIVIYDSTGQALRIALLYDISTLDTMNRDERFVLSFFFFSKQKTPYEWSASLVAWEMCIGDGV
ncbi:hypothetical protein [Enterococcus faecalis]|uniref:hypothetical protein n=1 Tax=Enterococcus faecalis TaxID=1351 RepID=UPI001A99E6C3|nr:hypothetical protein [Enterococcus faecalis]